MFKLFMPLSVRSNFQYLVYRTIFIWSPQNMNMEFAHFVTTYYIQFPNKYSLVDTAMHFVNASAKFSLPSIHATEITFVATALILLKIY